MSQQIINLGTADKGNGDVLRTAFTKVNENFAELYNSVSAVVVASATAPAGPGAGDLWWNSEDGRMYIYYGTSWVDASPVDGAGISSTDRLVNGNAELVLENDGTITSVTFPTRGTGKIGISGSEISTTPAGEGNYSAPLVLSSFSNDVWISPNGIGPRPKWEFKPDGTLNVPVPQGGLFTLTLSSANFIPRVGKTTLTLSGAPWVLEGQIQRNPDGSAELQLNQIFPKISNPGYVSGDTFTFDDQVHHLFGFNLEIGLADVVQAGPAGWTANLQANQLPQYPSTINSDGIIKLTANETSWLFSTDGSLTIPGYVTSQAGLPLNLQSSAGSNATLGISTGDNVVVVNDTSVLVQTNGTDTPNFWTFSTDGSLTFPDGTTTTGKGVTVPVDQSLTVNTSYSMGPGGATTFKINPESIKLPTGNGTIFSGTETSANSWGLDSANKTLYFPDADDGVNPQIYYSKADGVTGMELMTYAKSIKITAAQTNSWTFGTDGKLTLPGAIVKSTVAKTGVVLPTTTGAVNNVSFSPFDGSGGLTDAIYGPFLLGETSLSVIVQSGLPVVLQLQTQPILTVGDVIGTIDSGDLGGTPGTTFTASVYSVTQATPTSLDLTKSVNKLTEGEYTLANGVEGQIMYMVPQASVNTASDVRVTVANFRASTFTGTNGTMFPFRWYDGTGYIDNTGMCTLIFTDGAWQQQGGSWS